MRWAARRDVAHGSFEASEPVGSRVTVNGFARVATGWQVRQTGELIPRHRHREAYAAVVLSGGYEECGNRGRFRVGPGDVLLHGAFDAHLNRFPRQGARILNLLDPGRLVTSGYGRVIDPDAIVRAAERDRAEALALLHMQFQSVPGGIGDWPDALARDLLADPACRLDRWARSHGLTAETLSRGFRKRFGVTPAFFRAESRFTRAFDLILDTQASLAAIAAEAGFADQAHMSRALRQFTGDSPSAWRRSSPFKTV